MQTPNDDSLRLEYELSQKMHNFYGKVLWQIGYIFLGASLAVFAYGLQQDLPKVSFIPLIMVITLTSISFLFVFRRYRSLILLHLARCREIEKRLGLQQHTLMEKADREEVNINGFRIKLPKPTTGSNVKTLILIMIIIFWVGVWRHEIYELLISILPL